MSARAIALAGLVLAARSAMAQAPVQPPTEVRPDVQRAIERFEKTDDERAAALFHKALKKGLPITDAALCHMYLGLIALNAFATDRAKDELRQALTIDPSAELPRSAAPKARELFAEVRAELHVNAAPTPTPTPTPPRIEQGTQLGAQPEPPPPLVVAPPTAEGGSTDELKIASYAVGATGLGAVVIGSILFGVASSTLSSMKAAPDILTASQLSNLYPKQEYAAEWFVTCGVLGMGLGLAGWLFDRTLDHPAAPTASTGLTGLHLATEGLRF